MERVLDSGAEDRLADAIRRQDMAAAEACGLGGNAWANARVYQRLYHEAARERELLIQALRAVVRANDSVDGAIGEILAAVGREAAVLAKGVLRS